MWFRFIWIKSFRKIVRKMERNKREENIKKMQEAAGVEGSVDYLSGIDDGYYMACEDILKWIEKKK
jgi:hypothetical protein